MATINENNGGNTMSMTTVNNMENYMRKDNGIIVASAASIFPQRDFWLHATEQYAIFPLEEEDYAGYAIELFTRDGDTRIRILTKTESSDDCEFSVSDMYIMSNVYREKLVDEYGGSEELLNDFIKFVTTNNTGHLYNEFKEAYELDKLIETVINLSELRDWPIWLILKNWEEIDEIFRKDDE